MARLAWLTDIHLNFLGQEAIESFLDEVRSAEADAILIGGDIGEADDVLDYLIQLNDALDPPIYFVLGNHDYYRGSIREVRRKAARLCKSRTGLHYLTNSGPFTIAPDVALVGHDGWADGRVGDYERSVIMMTDYKLIEELSRFGKRERLVVLQALGDEAADHIRRVLSEALAGHRRVVLLTHVPPLREACWYEGQISDDQWSPHFTCLAMGQAILDIMRDFADHHLTVLCGHTHSPGRCQPLPNVEILTGGAEYGFPRVQSAIEV